jgi:hypothetical protein
MNVDIGETSEGIYMCNTVQMFDVLIKLLSLFTIFERENKK